jgi:hypothetical protein
MEFQYENTFASKLKLSISLILSNWPILKIVIENDLVKKNNNRYLDSDEIVDKSQINV